MGKSMSDCRPLRWVIAISSVLVFVAGSGVLLTRSRDGATPLSAADAVSRFRTSATAARPVDPAALTGPTMNASTAGRPASPTATVSATAPEGPASEQPTPGTAPTPAAADPLPAAGRSAGRTAATSATAPEERTSQQPPPGTAPTPAETGPLPADGVYLYNTTGSEEVDILGGAHHDYPAQTTITVQRAGCGLVTRWDAIRERWDERRSCLADRRQDLREIIQHHEFFRTADERHFTCDPGSFDRPADETPGATWTIRCATDDTVATTTLTLVGVEPVDVGGQSVEALHVRSVTSIDGATKGTQRFESWLLRTNGLLVRRVSTNDSISNSRFGKAHYREYYELRLTSLQPQT